MADSKDDYAERTDLWYRRFVVFSPALMYWVYLGFGRAILVAMHDLDVRRGTVNDLVIMPQILDWISADALFFLSGIILVSSLIVRARHRIDRQKFYWSVLLSTIMINPIIFDLGTHLFCPSPIIDTVAWKCLGPYLVGAVPGSVGASIAWVSTLLLLPVIVFAFRILNSRWPTYSVRSLVIFMAGFSGAVSWSLGYVRLFERTKWLLFLG
ncbi:MAG: hypothetical protein HS116_10200 [Planctomycetes bacterium]|nr:hypothetical protein [Planctomycetota bacterium]